MTEWTEAEGKIINQDGMIAVGYYQPIFKLVTLRSGKVYNFTNNYVTMAWVEPGDVDEILALAMSCCGGRQRGAFVLANANYVRRYQGQELVGR